MTDYLIRLSWPDSGLSQNARGHWSKKARKVKAARHEAWALAKQQKVTCIPDAVLEFSFSPPTDKRKARDLQNMPEMMKAAIDGIADAMGCDDKLFKPVWPTEFEVRYLEVAFWCISSRWGRVCKPTLQLCRTLGLIFPHSMA